MTRLAALALVAGIGLAASVAGSPAGAADDPTVGATAEPAAAAPEAGGGAPSANPLWGIGIKQLANTRDRPLFSPSRRPPPPPPVLPPVAAAPPPVEKPKEPESPQMALLGTIVNHVDGYGIFMDQTVSQPVRIKVGSNHRGWTLRKITATTATLEKNGQTAELAFPKKPGESVAKKEGLGSFLAATGAALRGSLDKLENVVPSSPDEQRMARRGGIPAEKPLTVPQGAPPFGAPPRPPEKH
jgi:general secretion pathway protein N